MQINLYLKRKQKYNLKRWVTFPNKLGSVQIASLCCFAFQHAQQDRALTQTDRKIDTEVADLKTMLETHKLDNIKYLAGKESGGYLWW